MSKDLLTEEKEGSFMELTTAQEIIVNLKTVKEKQGLSIPQIKQMVDATGAYLSLSTLRRVFAEGSEEDSSFSYENTIRPIAQVLLINDVSEDESVTHDKINGLLAIIHHKAEIITSLRSQVDDLRRQIEIKDRRMDEQAQRIDKLMDKLLEKV